MTDENKIKEAIEIRPELINKALVRALDNWDVGRAMSEVASKQLSEILSSVLKEMRPQIERGIKDALAANLSAIIKGFVKQMRNNMGY